MHQFGSDLEDFAGVVEHGLFLDVCDDLIIGDEWFRRNRPKIKRQLAFFFVQKNRLLASLLLTNNFNFILRKPSQPPQVRTSNNPTIVANHSLRVLWTCITTIPETVAPTIDTCDSTKLVANPNIAGCAETRYPKAPIAKKNPEIS